MRAYNSMVMDRRVVARLVFCAVALLAGIAAASAAEMKSGGGSLGPSQGTVGGGVIGSNRGGAGGVSNPDPGGPAGSFGGPEASAGPRATTSSRPGYLGGRVDETVPVEVGSSLEILDETRLRPPPVPVDQDDDAEAIVQARIRAAEMRNRPHLEVDHRSFHERVMQQAAKATPPGGEAARKGRERLRAAIVWREILGPPKAFEEW